MLQQLELRFVLQMEWCITHHIRAQDIETTLQCTKMNLLRCKVEGVLEAVSGFTNPFSSRFEDNELYFFVFRCSCYAWHSYGFLLRLMALAGRLLQTSLTHF